MPVFNAKQKISKRVPQCLCRLQAQFPNSILADGLFLYKTTLLLMYAAERYRAFPLPSCTCLFSSGGPEIVTISTHSPSWKLYPGGVGICHMCKDTCELGASKIGHRCTLCYHSLTWWRRRHCRPVCGVSRPHIKLLLPRKKNVLLQSWGDHLLGYPVHEMACGGSAAMLTFDQLQCSSAFSWIPKGHEDQLNRK